MGKFFKFLLACVLLPITCLVVWQDVRILLSVLGHLSATISFVLGGAVYAGVHYKYYNFSRLYVFMHEMTHAVAAILCGVRIKDVRVGQASGYVKMSRTNTFIALAPYFVPGYVVLLAMLYLLLSFFMDLTPYRHVMLFLVGFFMTFHFIQTFHTLWEADQPDLQLAGGKFFSCVSIVLANMLVLAVVLKILFPQDVFLWTAVKEVAAQVRTGWQIIVNYILERIK
ncbi:MAG: M50 family metallopeptidase [Elusimicrobiaceae bacterium]|nr:M50 family metallopeptidase [Elusimicrobiaceae bacterium]